MQKSKHNKNRNIPRTGCFRVVVGDRVFDNWQDYKKTRAYKRLKREYSDKKDK